MGAPTILSPHKDGITSRISMWLYVIIFLIAVRLSYWLFIFTKLALHKHTSYTTQEDGVSIVVCVKNNLAGIKNLLQKALKQNHTSYEIIIVDDFSTDGLKDYLDTIDQPLITYLHSSKDIPGKKLALSEGIMASRYEWILLTDSDCKPASLDWIKHMLSVRKEGTDLVLGVSPLSPQRGLSAILAAYESMYILMQYLSYALWRKPYMGVGRNLLFKKSSFIDHGPFDDNWAIASGDDDFIVKAISTSSNTEICTHPNAFTSSPAPVDFNMYLRQKLRHVSTSFRYTSFHQFLLGLFGVSHILSYISIIMAVLFHWVSYKEAAGLYLMMMGLIFIVQVPIFSKLKQSQMMAWILPADLLLCFFYLFLGIKSFFNREKYKSVWTS